MSLEDHYARDPIPTWVFVLIVVHDGDKYLLIQENKDDHPWYLPAGRVEPGESLLQAAEREVVEEAGIPIFVENVIRVDYTPFPEGVSRVRVYLTARPQDDTTPKSQPDENSLQAGWFTLDEMEEMTLRGEEAFLLCKYVEVGAPLYPLDILGVDDFKA